MMFATLSSPAPGQTPSTPPSEHSGSFLLFEAAVGTRLNQQPDPGANDARWYASWELGPMVNRGSWAWGATVMAAVDEDGSRWGLRPRYRRWLGSRAALDFGAGVLLGGGTNYGEAHYPGFAGLVGINYGNWLGVNLELHAVRTTVNEGGGYYDPVTGREMPVASSSSIDLAFMLGARMSGSGGLVLSGVEFVLLLIAAASMSGSGW